jgi:hypothetical protein
MNPPVAVANPSSMASEVYKYHRLHPELVGQLVSIYRIMFPHNGVPDEFYEHVVQKLDDKAEQNQDLSRFLSEGVEALNGQTGSAWISLSEEARLAIVAQMRKLLRGDRDQQTGVRRGALEALTWTQIVQAVSKVWNEPWEELLSARGTGARQTALFIGRIRGRLSLKELGQLAGGIHHNAVGIAIRRFTQRLQSDRTLFEKVSLVQKELEPH